ncbi:hypothetical protein EIP91_008073 [Steccherinum ochraceum]|uniref:Alpha/beta hydrolase fold-3 domain-containing protein n=1 Tax=Steccherinum ochraceum TaxID=92696 RepID=A0A4V2MXA5_9APHY|nr:hypothetical protein EIP91_008073 [Steccherinum ochraceum]
MLEFFFYKQPWKAVFITYHFITTLTIRVPLWLVFSFLPFTRLHPTWTFKRDFLVRFLKHYLHVASGCGGFRFIPMPTHLALVEGLNVKGLWVTPTPQLIVGDVKRWAEKANVEPIRIPGYWMEQEGSNREIGEAPRPGEKVVYHIHGGGYATHSAHPTNPTANIPRGIMKHSEAVMRTFSIEYRTSSGPPFQEITNPFPAALLDAIAGYNYLINVVKFKPEDIIVEGDSAGGNLALALVRYLVENQSQTESPNVTIPPPPGELLLFSPWCDIGDSDVRPDTTIYTNRSYDFINLLSKGAHRSKVNFLGPLGMEGANSNRYISPASTAPTMEPFSFKGFPRTFIAGGGAEVLIDQIRQLKNKMVADLGEGQVEYFEASGAIHDYLVLVWLEPERSETLRRVASWIAPH